VVADDAGADDPADDPVDAPVVTGVVAGALAAVLALAKLDGLVGSSELLVCWKPQAANADAAANAANATRRDEAFFIDGPCQLQNRFAAHKFERRDDRSSSKLIKLGENPRGNGKHARKSKTSATAHSRSFQLSAFSSQRSERLKADG
jgi:hypothetical protein